VGADHLWLNHWGAGGRLSRTETRDKDRSLEGSIVACDGFLGNCHSVLAGVRLALGSRQTLSAPASPFQGVSISQHHYRWVARWPDTAIDRPHGPSDRVRLERTRLTKGTMGVHLGVFKERYFDGSLYRRLFDAPLGHQSMVSGRKIRKQKSPPHGGFFMPGVRATASASSGPRSSAARPAWPVGSGAGSRNTTRPRCPSSGSAACSGNQAATLSLSVPGRA
jgi:hypothetical protein